MVATYSPLRYPGGKSSMLPLVSEIIRCNRLLYRPYVEPYAGGGGLALGLLYGGVVSEIHLNDLDPNIYAFWHSALEMPDAFAGLIQDCPLSVDYWKQQKEVHASSDSTTTSIERGFAAFYLNRTSRSGIIGRSGVIGGLDQRGNYKIDCRFNREALIQRILRLGKYKDRIFISNQDALRFLDRVESNLPPKTFCCIDPPYFAKGSRLYTNHYHASDHAQVARRIRQLDVPTMITYDDVPEIRSLYKSMRQHLVPLNYSVQTKRVSAELLILGKGVRAPSKLMDMRV